MTSTPMTLEDALRLSGYTIDAYEASGQTITTPNGPIVIPPMILSRLTWHRDESPSLGSAFYLDKLPPFHPTYAPVQLSLILDRFRSRRLGYETPDEFALAVRRWGALHLGAMSTLTRRYLSTAVDLPLDTVALTVTSESTGSTSDDGSSASTSTESGSSTSTTTESGSDNVTSTDTTNTTTKGRDAQSEFPQGTLANNADYASGAVDRVGTGNVAGSGTTEAEREQSGSATAEDAHSSSRQDEDHRTTSQQTEETRSERGRSGQSVMSLLAEQRAMFVNVDEELLTAMESLFLGVFDRSTADDPTPHPYRCGWGW